MQQKHSNKIEADLKKQMTAISRESVVSRLVLFLYFRVSFISVLGPKKRKKIDHRFSFSFFSRETENWKSLVNFSFLFFELKKNENWAQIFIFHFSTFRKNEWPKHTRIKSVFQCHAWTKNEKWKWNLNSIFPCHRKTVGTKVHAFIFSLLHLDRLRYRYMKHPRNFFFFAHALNDFYFFLINIENGLNVRLKIIK